MKENVMKPISVIYCFCQTWLVQTPNSRKYKVFQFLIPSEFHPLKTNICNSSRHIKCKVPSFHLLTVFQVTANWPIPCFFFYNNFWKGLHGTNNFIWNIMNCRKHLMFCNAKIITFNIIHSNYSLCSLLLWYQHYETIPTLATKTLSESGWKHLSVNFSPQ